MATTSPYSPNDYQAVSSLRPYQLPVNDIFKANAALNQYWDEGARTVKNAYQTVLDLNLTSDENKQVRDEFVKKAQEQITKLSKMNLADPGVQREGIGILKPIFQDKDIMMDDHLTTKYQSIVDDANRYKMDEKTKGDGYNTDNLLYALRPFKGFGRATRRGEIGQIFDKAKDSSYTPYHDVSKEYMDLYSKCKPNKMSSNSVQGLYYVEQEDNSLSSEKLNGCIKSGISDKAWQQLRITGTVRLENNMPYMAQKYNQILQGNNRAHSSELMGLQAELKALKDNKKLTPELEKAYNEHIAGLNTRIKENQVVSSRIQAGDLTDVNKDFDHVVAQVWADDDIGGFANAWSYADVSKKYTDNHAAIAQYNQANENARFSRTMDFNQAKFQVETMQKEKENDINLLKALTSGKDGGSISAQMLIPLMQKLGINPEITPMLDTGKEGDNSQTYYSIKEKADSYYQERIQSAYKLSNILKDLSGDSGAVEEGTKNEQGIFSLEKTYNMGEEYLKKYYAGNPGGLPDAKIKDLEAALNEYQDNKSKSWSFFKIQNDIQSALDKNPEIQNKIKGYDKVKNDFIKEVGNKDFFMRDPIKDELVRINTKDLANMMDDSNPLYKVIVVNPGGGPDWKIIRKSDGVEMGKEKTFLGTGIGRTHEPPNRGNLRLIYNTNVARRNDLNPIVQSVAGNIVRNSNVYNATTYPGLGASLKQALNFIPEFQGDNFSIRPGLTIKDPEGNAYTKVEVWNKGAKKTDPDVQVENNKISDIITNNKVSLNSEFGNIKMIGGELYVKTNFLPIAGASYGLSDVMENYATALTKVPIGAGESKSQMVKIIPGGFKIGFDAVGQGVNYPSNSPKPSIYRAWYMDPSGNKTYVAESPLINQISNSLQGLEAQMSQIVAAHYKKK